MTDPTKPFLTYKLDLAKTLATKATDPYYQKSVGLRVRELRVLRLVHDFPGIAATAETNAGRPPRTRGSPPVTFTRSTEKRAASHRTASASSARRGISPRGTSGTPASGMQ